MYIPEFKGPVEGYVVNTITKQLWRVSRTHDREDLMQEAHVVFLRCASRYPIIDTPQHFMSLFKTAWTNALNDLSNKATKARALVSESLFDAAEDQEWQRDHVGELDNAGALAVMVRQAPREVAMVLNLFLNAPQELLDLAQEAWKRSGRRNAEGNEMINQLLGLEPGSNPLGDVEQYFNRH